MSDAAVQVIQLPSQFVQLQLGALKTIVDHHHDDGESVQFDAMEVERMDGLAAQFLLAVARKQAQGGANPLVINTNEIVLNALADMGLTDWVNVQVSSDLKAA